MRSRPTLFPCALLTFCREASVMLQSTAALNPPGYLPRNYTESVQVYCSKHTANVSQDWQGNCPYLFIDIPRVTICFCHLGISVNIDHYRLFQNLNMNCVAKLRVSATMTTYRISMLQAGFLDPDNYTNPRPNVSRVHLGVRLCFTAVIQTLLPPQNRCVLAIFST
ncbi:hypothetical protein F5878DRAFT_132647 [Lentinula raphanica]|uniref:Uncharacterized protein n=1 Tax=Lentinula raphanica TaxID=153919 RepID=A0AA38UF60_9AGAR|nr:hypothetical protein F5878DRAFT_132647 [Lentinula raphanica]